MPIVKVYKSILLLFYAYVCIVFTAYYMCLFDLNFHKYRWIINQFPNYSRVPVYTCKYNESVCLCFNLSVYLSVYALHVCMCTYMCVYLCACLSVFGLCQCLVCMLWLYVRTYECMYI